MTEPQVQQRVLEDAPERFGLLSATLSTPRRHDDERGYAIAMVLVLAFVFSIASFGVLFVAISQGRQTRFYEQRVKARYAAEGAIAWALQQLFLDGRWKAPSGLPVAVGGFSVVVTMPACTQPAPGCEHPRELQAKVTYSTR